MNQNHTKNINNNAKNFAPSRQIGFLTAVLPNVFFLLFPFEKAYSQTCFTAACHTIITDAKYLHTAIKESGCSDCHIGNVQIDPEKPATETHKLELAAVGNELCYQCHDKFGGNTVHSAVEDGGCLSCHSPHSSQYPSLVKNSLTVLCAECHERKDSLLSVHSPVRAGTCANCHYPHASNLPHLLKLEGNSLCLNCHNNKIDLKAPHIHSPIADGECSDCHFSHQSNFQPLLKSPQEELCNNCHDSVATKPFVHSALRLGRCSGCHTPHTGANEKLLLEADADKLCFRCHSDDLTGRKVIHQPVKDGDCFECHFAHSSETPKLLVESKDRLCYKCHDRKDEKPNVHKVLIKGGCTACHDPHATANKNILIAPVNDLCSACHPEQKDGSHIFTGIAGTPHPVSGKGNIANQEREFSCISCHAPHSSDFPKLFYEGKTKMEMCKRCHSSL